MRRVRQHPPKTSRGSRFCSWRSALRRRSRPAHPVCCLGPLGVFDVGREGDQTVPPTLVARVLEEWVPAPDCPERVRQASDLGADGALPAADRIRRPRPSAGDEARPAPAGRPCRCRAAVTISQSGRYCAGDACRSISRKRRGWRATGREGLCGCSPLPSGRRPSKPPGCRSSTASCAARGRGIRIRSLALKAPRQPRPFACGVSRRDSLRRSATHSRSRRATRAPFDAPGQTRECGQVANSGGPNPSAPGDGPSRHAARSGSA
jgi:hypothetical protein